MYNFGIEYIFVMMDETSKRMNHLLFTHIRVSYCCDIRKNERRGWLRGRRYDYIIRSLDWC